MVKINRTGTTRNVILVGRYAIKVPVFVEWRLFLKGLLANMQEVRFSKTGWVELCPVVFYIPGGFALVMKRARALDKNEVEWLENNYENFINRNSYIIPVEHKADSFGVLNGKIVVVDYGN